MRIFLMMRTCWQMRLLEVCGGVAWATRLPRLGSLASPHVGSSGGVLWRLLGEWLLLLTWDLGGKALGSWPLLVSLADGNGSGENGSGIIFPDPHPLATAHPLTPTGKAQAGSLERGGRLQGLPQELRPKGHMAQVTCC